MRRTLALTVLAVAAAAAFPISPAAAAPDCDVTGNCPCLIVAHVVYKATGEQIHCA